MSRPTTAIKSEIAGMDFLRELAAEYAEAHGVTVRIAQRTAEGWSVDADMPAYSALPVGITTPFALPGGSEAYVEIGGIDDDAARRMGRFLADVLAAEAKHHFENRFLGQEIADRYEEITLLYTISEILGSVISLEQAAATILAEVADAMGVRRAALWILEPGSESLERVASVGEEGSGESILVADGDSMTAAVFRSRTPMLLDAEEVFPRDNQARPVHRESFLSVPVSYTPPRGDTRTIGVINLIGRTGDEGFSAGNQKLITAIASQIGAAIENNRLIAENVRQQRLAREMELAHDLQLKLLPSPERFSELGEVAARCVPADSVGGDFYHLFRLPHGRVGVMMGDVATHGFAAALIMALTMSAVAIHASEGDPPAEVLRRVHRALIDELESTEMYMTLFYGVIDPEARSLTFANAGHSHAFHIAGNGGQTRLSVTNPPFGIVNLDNYAQQSVEWTPGEDLLFLFTDGLSEALSAPRGEKTLTELVSAGRKRPFNTVMDELFALEPDRSDIPADDRSALLIRI